MKKSKLVSLFLVMSLFFSCGNEKTEQKKKDTLFLVDKAKATYQMPKKADFINRANGTLFDRTIKLIRGVRCRCKNLPDQPLTVNSYDITIVRAGNCIRQYSINGNLGFFTDSISSFIRNEAVSDDIFIFDNIKYYSPYFDSTFTLSPLVWIEK